MKTVVKIVLVAVLALASAAPLSAQRYRGDRRVIRGGLMPKPDSLRNDAPAGTSLFSGADSLRQDSTALAASDSLRGSDMALASLYRNRPDSLRTGSMADSLLWFACAETKFDFNRLLPDSLPVLDVVIEAEMADSLKKKREPFFSDSMSLPRCAGSRLRCQDSVRYTTNSIGNCRYSIRRSAPHSECSYMRTAVTSLSRNSMTS